MPHRNPLTGRMPCWTLPGVFPARPTRGETRLVAFARRFEVRALSQRVTALGLEEVLDVSEPLAPASPKPVGRTSPWRRGLPGWAGLILCARSPLTHTHGAASAKGALRRPCKGSKTAQTKCVRILARAIWSLINQKKMSETTETNRSSFCLGTSFHFPLWPRTGVGGAKARLPRGSQTPAVRAISGLQAWYFAVNWPDHDLLLV